MGFLTGKTAIITGAGRAVLSDGSCGSIGYGIATAFAKEGANLVITGRNVKKLEEAKTSWKPSMASAFCRCGQMCVQAPTTKPPCKMSSIRLWIPLVAFKCW